MPIDRDALVSTLQAVINLPFPDAPEGEELGECMFELLLLDADLAGRFTSAINGNWDVIDFSDLKHSLSGLRSLEDRLLVLPVASTEEYIRNQFIDYVRALEMAGDLLCRTDPPDLNRLSE